jgi:hypothetical protein
MREGKREVMAAKERKERKKANRREAEGCRGTRRRLIRNGKIVGGTIVRIGCA